MTGRNTDCTPQITRQIAGRIAGGLSNRDAVALAGITESTFYGWLKRGEVEHGRMAESSRRKPKKSEAPFLEFFETVKKAIPRRKRVLVDIIKKAAGGGETITETKRTYKEVEQKDIDGQPYFARILVEEVVTEKKRAPEWTAAAWLLERLHHEEFGRRNRVDVYDWRKEVKEMLDSGAITPEDIRDELGPDIAQEFFESAGLHYVGSGPAKVESETE